jgi:hypothetical protein
MSQSTFVYGGIIFKLRFSMLYAFTCCKLYHSLTAFGFDAVLTSSCFVVTNTFYFYFQLMMLKLLAFIMLSGQVTPGFRLVYI